MAGPGEEVVADMGAPSPIGKPLRLRLSQQLTAAEATEETIAVEPSPKMRCAKAAPQPSPSKMRTAKAMSSTYAASLFDADLAETVNQTVVIAFLYFKQPLDLRQVQKAMLERLCAIPRFRSKPVNTAGAGKRVAVAFQQLTDEDMEEFMPKLVQDKTGTISSDEDIAKFCSEMYSERPDTDMPLWRCYICNNMADGRSMLIYQFDHAIADGVALVQTLMSTLDDQEDVIVPTRKTRSPPVDCFAKLKGLVNSCWGPFISDQFPGDPQNRLKNPNPRKPGKTKAVFSTPALSMKQVKEVQAKIPGATINDVLMTIVSLTLQIYFERYEPSSLKQKVRANFPINMRKETGEAILTDRSFGNRFSQGQLTFPIHLKDPRAIFANVKSQIDVIKVSPEPLVREKLVNFVVLKSGLAWKNVFDVLLDAFGKVTAMLSNVPGPLTKVKFIGQELDDLSFYAFGPIGLYFGIVQYAGQFKGGIAMDAAVEPEPQKLADCWLPAYDRLLASVQK